MIGSSFLLLISRIVILIYGFHTVVPIAFSSCLRVLFLMLFPIAFLCFPTVCFRIAVHILFSNVFHTVLHMVFPNVS